MKRCPHCKALAFDDMDVCYGCMYRFTEQDRPMAHDSPSTASASAAGTVMPVQAKDAGPECQVVSFVDAEKWRRFDDELERFLNGHTNGEEGSPRAPDVPLEEDVDACGSGRTVATLIRYERDGREVPYVLLPGCVISIGRSSRNDIILPAPNVSRQHARVGVLDGKVWLEDMGSSNHTYFRGEAVRRRIDLAVGDEFLICGTTFRIKGPAEPAPVRERVPAGAA